MLFVESRASPPGRPTDRGNTLIPPSTLWPSLSIRHHHSAFNFWDTEVPTQMREVERTDRPCYHDKVDLIRPGQQNRDVAHRVILQANPEVAHTRASVLFTVVHQLLPARRVILLFHGA